MIMKFLNLFSASIHVATHVDYARFAIDPEYPRTLIAELVGEPESGQGGATKFDGDATDESDRLAA